MYRPTTATRLSVAPSRLITRHKSSKSPSSASNVAPQPVKKGEEDEVKAETKTETATKAQLPKTASTTSTAASSPAPSAPAPPYENNPYMFNRGHFTPNFSRHQSGNNPSSSPTRILGIQPHPFTVKEHTGESMNEIFLHKALASHMQPLLLSLDDRKREVPSKVYKFRNQRQVPKAENSLWLKSVLRQQTHSDMDLIPPEMLQQMVPFQPLSDVTRKFWDVKMKVDFKRQQQRKREPEEEEDDY
ncbi:hypothetical protein CJU90_2245 [Yarrowia sp. C11]|nr:hypothetical protein CKK34_6273 [Yarrowia sp. E02]KAG5372164.1 hypothetical protein CJU90_2245 [Yarrowia sp. C11]